MSNEVINVQQLPKETIAKFVNDAAEMEISSFTLKQTASETEKQANSLKWSASNKLKRSQEALDNSLQKYKQAENKLNNAKNNAASYNYSFSLKNDTAWKPFILLSIFLAPIIAFAILNIYYLCCGTDLDTVVNTNPIESVCADFSIFYILTCAIIFLIIQIKNRTEKKQDNEYHANKFANTINESEQFAEKCKDEYNNLVRENNNQMQTSKEQEQKAKELDDHAVMLRKQASEIDAALQQHYSLGVIPPDYRDMLRVLYIQRAFRNDQVDTMREATLLCDRDVYHIEIKNGLSEIANAIQSLSSTLNDISWNITRMNSELRDIANGQEKLISETESARYATESVRRAQEDILWYERQNWKRNN